MDVELSVVGQVVVDDERNLRNIQAPSPDIGGDQHTTETQKPRGQSLNLNLNLVLVLVLVNSPGS